MSSKINFIDKIISKKQKKKIKAKIGKFFDFVLEFYPKTKTQKYILGFLFSVIFLLIAYVAWFELSHSREEIFIFQNARTVSVSKIVAGMPVKFVTLVDVNEIKNGKHLVKIPKIASDITINKITPAEIKNIKNNKLVSIKPEEKLALAKSVKIIARVKLSKNLFGSLVQGTGFLLADGEQAVEQLITAVLPDSSSQLIDVSGVAGVEQPITTQDSQKQEQKPVDQIVETAPNTETTTNDVQQPAGQVDERAGKMISGIVGKAVEQLKENGKIDGSSIISDVTKDVDGGTNSNSITDTTSPSSAEVVNPDITKQEVLPQNDKTDQTQDTCQGSETDNCIAVEYTMPSPTIEKTDTDNGQMVTVSIPVSAENANIADLDKVSIYTDVLAYTTIPEIYKVGDESKIKIKWKTNDNQDVQFIAKDLDGNGMIDYLEWVVPHLSDQTFEIIFISKAFQLDADKNITADIYDQVSAQDDTWASIADGAYIRATFDQALTDKNDITIVARPTDSENPGQIEVYPVYTDDNGNAYEGSLLTKFSQINRQSYYKVFLDGLETPTDIFDLKITGNIDFDLVVDPWSLTGSITKRLGGTTYDYGYAVTTDNNNNIIVAGYVNGNADFDSSNSISAGLPETASATYGSVDAFVAVYNSSGVFQWAKRIGGTGGDYGYAVTTDTANNVIVAGSVIGNADFDMSDTISAGLPETVSARYSGNDAFFVVYTSAGTFVRARRIGGTGGDQAFAVTTDTNNNVIMTGSINGNADLDSSDSITGTLPETASARYGGNDVFFTVYDSSGNFVRAKRLGGAGADIGYGVATDTANNVIVAGYITSNADLDSSDSITNALPETVSARYSSADAFFAVYDSSGNFVRAKRLGGTGVDYAWAVATDTANNVIVAGQITGNADFDSSDSISAGLPETITARYSLSDGFFAVYDSSGNFVRAKRLGGTGADIIYGVAADTNNNIIVAGQITGNADLDMSDSISVGLPETITARYSGIDAFLAVYNSSGVFQWANRLGGVGADYGQAVTTDLNNNVIITGYVTGTVDLNANDAYNSGLPETVTATYTNTDVFFSTFAQTTNTPPLITVDPSDGGLTSSNATAVGANVTFTVTATDADSNNYYLAICKSGLITANANGAPTCTDGSWCISGSTASGAQATCNWADTSSVLGSYEWNAYVCDYNANSLCSHPSQGTGNNGSPFYVTNADTLLTAKRLGGGGADYGYAVATDNNNNIIVAGYVNGNADLNMDDTISAGLPETASARYGGNDAFFAVYNSAGVFIRAKRIGGTGDDRAFAVTTDTNNNVIVAGQVSGSSADFNMDDTISAGLPETASARYGNVDAYFVVYDSSGNFVRAKRIGGTSVDAAYAVTTDTNNNIIVAGSINGNADLNSSDSISAGLPETPSARYGSSYDAFYAVYDSSGNYVRAKRLGGTGLDYAYAVTTDTTNKVIVAGYVTGNADLDMSDAISAGLPETASATYGSSDIFFSVYDSSGNFVRAKRLGGTGADIGQGITTDTNNNIIVTGSITGNADLNMSDTITAGLPETVSTTYGGTDAFFAVYDSSGNFVRAKRLGGTGADVGLGVTTDSNNNIIVVGYVTGNADLDMSDTLLTASPETAVTTVYGGLDAFLSTYDSSGNFKWATRFGEGNNDYGYAVATDNNNNIITVGAINGNPDLDSSNTVNAGLPETATVRYSGYDVFFTDYSQAGKIFTLMTVGPSDGGSTISLPTAVGANVTFTATATDQESDNYYLAICKTPLVSGNANGVPTCTGGNWCISGSTASGSQASCTYTAQSTDSEWNDWFAYVCDYNATSSCSYAVNQGTGDTGSGFGVSSKGVSFVRAKRLGGTTADFGYGVTTDNNNNIIITGGITGNADLDSSDSISAGLPETASARYGGSDAFFAVYNSSGVFVRAKRLGGTGSDVAQAVTTDTNNNIIIAGYITGNADFDSSDSISAGLPETASATYGGTDAFFAVYDSSGNFVRAKRLGGTGADVGLGVTTDSNNNVIVAGYLTGNADLNASDSISAGLPETASATYGGKDAFFAVYDSSGNYVRAKRLGGTGIDDGYAVTTDNNNNIIIAGDVNGNADLDMSDTISAGLPETPGSMNNNDAFFAVYNSSGVFQWARRIGGTGGDYAYAITTDSNNNIIVGGYITYDADLDMSGSISVGLPETAPGTASASYIGYDGFFAVYNSSGVYQLAKRIAGTSSVYVYGVTTDNNNNIIVSGYITGNVDLDISGAISAGLPETPTATFGSQNNIFVAVYNPSGIFQWARRLGISTWYNIGYAVTTDTNNNVIVAGNLYGNADLDMSDTITNSLPETKSARYNSYDAFFSEFSQPNASLTSVSASPSPIKGGNTITVTPTGQGDSASLASYYYCNETGAPISGNTLCSQANTSYSSPYSSMTCTYNVTTGDATRTVYCRTFDGTNYSTVRTTTYTVDTTAPSFSFSDNVAVGPVASDTITASWGDASVKKWDYSASATCSTTAGDYSKTDSNSINQSTETNNNKYICLYGEDSVGNKSTLASANKINIDVTAPTLSFSDNVEVGPVASDTITGSWGDASVKKWDYDADGVCSTTAGDYSKTNSNSMNQTSGTNNGKYICLYGEDSVGNKATLASAHVINIITNTLPYASDVSIDSGALAVNLIEGATKNIVCAGTVTDVDGYSDITSVTAKLYRGGIDPADGDNNANHYTLTGDSHCIPSGGLGNTETYTCTFPVQFYADPTDAGSTYESENWVCQMTPTDTVSAGSSSTDTIEMNSLTAFSTTTSINYSPLVLGANTGSDDQITTITNTGNRAIDVKIHGYASSDGDGKAMNCTIGNIIIDNEKYSLTPSTDYTSKTALGSTDQLLTSFNLVKGVSSTKNIYWGMGLTASGGGSCSGKINFTAVNH